jgi:predicted phage-related endonuclease
MGRKLAALTFTDQVRQQLMFLRHPEYEYSALHLYVMGVGEPWEFGPEVTADPCAAGPMGCALV